MKLLSLTKRYYLISLLVFFSIAGVVLFFAIRFHLNEELDEQLRTEQKHVVNAIRSITPLNESTLSLYDNFLVKDIPFGVVIKPEIFDSLMYDDEDKDLVPFRLIRFSAQIKTSNFAIAIKKSKIETSDLVLSIFLTLMFVFALFCMILYLSTSYLNRKIWSPFLQTISAIKTLNIIDQDDSFKFKVSRIDELNELNASLQIMIERIKSDFLQMKEFSENAAHELQTPLTIIRSKMETLLQSKDLNDENAQLINQALENTVRLSRINQSLLLLTKIENRQFEQKQLVHFSVVFDKYIELFSEMIVRHRIVIHLNKDEDFLFEMNPMLTDILISNLLGNAIKHNVGNGNILIYLKRDGFEIKNSGEAPDSPTELMFNRFKKGNHSAEHLGLGLALVREIVQTNGLEILYRYDNGQHIIIVKMADPKKNERFG